MRSSKHALTRAGCSTDGTIEILTRALTRAGCSTDGTIEILTRALTRAGCSTDGTIEILTRALTRAGCSTDGTIEILTRALTRAGCSTDGTIEILTRALTRAGFSTDNTNETGGSRHSPPRCGHHSKPASFVFFEDKSEVYVCLWFVSIYIPDSFSCTELHSAVLNKFHLATEFSSVSIRIRCKIFGSSVQYVKKLDQSSRSTT